MKVQWDLHPALSCGHASLLLSVIVIVTTMLSHNINNTCWSTLPGLLILLLILSIFPNRLFYPWSHRQWATYPVTVSVTTKANSLLLTSPTAQTLCLKPLHVLQIRLHQHSRALGLEDHRTFLRLLRNQAHGCSGRIIGFEVKLLTLSCRRKQTSKCPWSSHFLLQFLSLYTGNDNSFCRSSEV